MALAFGAVTSVTTGNPTTGPTVTGSDTIGIVFHMGDSAADNLSAVDWGGSAMTKITSVKTPGDRWISAWYVIAPSSGATITFTGSTVNRAFSLYYTGAKQTGQPDSSNTGTSSANAAITVATTVVASNCWTLMFQKDDTGSITYSTSVGTMRINADAGGLAMSDSNGTVGTGSQSTTLTGTGTPNHGGIALSIAPSVAVTGSVSSNLSLLGVG